MKLGVNDMSLHVIVTFYFMIHDGLVNVIDENRGS
jgi:hypothetical protein